MDKRLSLIFLILGVAASPCSVGAQEVNFTISLFATDLRDCDATSACDPFVKIMCASLSSDWRLCGTTSVLQDDNFPVFPERFDFHYIPSENQRWRFDIIDQDVLFDDPIGSVSVSMQEFLTATEPLSTMMFIIPNNRGRFYVHRRQPI